MPPRAANQIQLPPGVDPALLIPDTGLASLEVEDIKRNGLYRFVQYAWPVINPGVPFVGNWHLELVCAHLEAVSKGELDRLIITVPPGSSKSTICSVLWPAWDWINKPTRKWMVATFEDRLTGRDSLACRRLINSKWYQSRWGDRVRVMDDDDSQNTQEIWNTVKSGRRYSTTTGGGATGWHADIQIVDDPIKPKDMAGDPEQARSALERTWAWWTMTMSSRRTGSKFARVIIMQRLHEMDLVGRILEMDHEKIWTHVMVPMRFEQERACATRWGMDPRRTEGELLCPARWDEKAVKELEGEMGAQHAAAQLQQRPAPAGGNVFKRPWFDKRWMREDNPKWQQIAATDRDRYVALPRFFTGAISVDCSFKDVAGADNVAMVVSGESEAQTFIVDCIADRMDLNATERCIEALSLRHPFARAKLIEDKGNGPAVEQRIRKRIMGVQMVNPEGGKIGRANAASPMCEAGNVVFPDESEAEWVAAFVEELVTFPFARRDDRVDALTQLLIWSHAHSMGRYIAAMNKVRAGGLEHLRQRED